MPLSSPIYVLKSQAKALKNKQGISQSEALNIIARQQGFNSWSLLMSRNKDVYPQNYSEVLPFLNNGDLVLLAARPKVGKIVFAFGILAQAINNAQNKGFVFSLAERKETLLQRLASYNPAITQHDPADWLDCSNAICADYIISTLKNRVEPGDLIIIDYLQQLDEKRINPPIQQQIEQLKKFARDEACILIFISQINRDIGDRQNQRPVLSDIRLPNPLDLTLFNKIIFLYRENMQAKKMEVALAGKYSHEFNVGFAPEQPRCFDLE